MKKVFWILSFRFLIAFFFLAFGSPLRAEEMPLPALVLVDPKEAPPFIDDGNLKDLKKSIEQSLQYYRQLSSRPRVHFGAQSYLADDLIDILEDLRIFLESSPSKSKLNQFIHDHFLIYRSVGAPNTGLVRYTAYYEYTFQAKLAPDVEFRYPLYARPFDLVDVHLENFDPKKKGERIVGRAEDGNLIPYYTREEIDSKKVLAERVLEIAWAKDPLDILFLQIQGSGWIEVPNSTETYHIRYAGDNGRPFRSVGQVLIEKGLISKADFSRSRMIEYLNGLPEEDRQSLLNQNPRYIFFEIGSSTNQTRGALLVPLTAGRSIASDPKFYPEGALAWIQTEQPAIDHKGNVTGKKVLNRFVLNQDEGGAIKGPGRIDFFAGRGRNAQKLAENLWYEGTLYFFVKKK